MDGRDFIVMEYVSGQTLAELISAGPLSSPRAVDIARQIAAGLRAAHESEMLHRDIKPANVIIMPDGRVKITDFGLAMSLGSRQAGDGSTISGTIAYASPEQLQGQTVDQRSDLWSLGVTLYEMLTGHRPFQDDHLAALAYNIVHEEPESLSDCGVEIPPELRLVVERCLTKTPSRRCPTAADLLEDLKRAQKSLERLGAGEARPSIAVLPFANLSADREQEYFCEGIAEEVLTALTLVKGLRVAARASAFAYSRQNLDVRDIGRKLGVDTLLEGSVRKSGSRLRITAQLVNVADGYHLWSERYDREMADVFVIQDEIAHSIARALQVILSEEERQAIARVPTAHVEAYDHYLRGRQFFHQGRRKSLRYARQMFTRAAAIDPEYALAYTGIADCCSFLIHYYGESSDANIEESDRASRKALELAPDLAEAHASRGLSLWLKKRNDDASEEFETAVRLDPKQFDARYFNGRACFQQGKYADAARWFEEACQVREDHEARFFAAQSFTAMGRTGDAEASYRLAYLAVARHVELNPDDARATTIGAVALCRTGDPVRGLEWAERALAIDAEDAGVRYNVACLFALEGQSDRALDSLDEALAAGFVNREWFERDPDVDSLRSLPRFQALLAKR